MIKLKGITYASGFQSEKQKQFASAQKMIDSECLRHVDPYVPFQTGMLKKSGISGTVIGSGEIRYTAPYGKAQYYGNGGKGIEGMNASGGTKGLRGRYWFERMKADHKDEILRAAKEKCK